VLTLAVVLTACKDSGGEAYNFETTVTTEASGISTATGKCESESTASVEGTSSTTEGSKTDNPATTTRSSPAPIATPSSAATKPPATTTSSSSQLQSTGTNASYNADARLQEVFDDLDAYAKTLGYTTNWLEKKFLDSGAMGLAAFSNGKYTLSINYYDLYDGDVIDNFLYSMYDADRYGGGVTDTIERDGSGLAKTEDVRRMLRKYADM